MKNTENIPSNDFEFVIFELVSEGVEINSNFINVQLKKLYAKYTPMANRQAFKFHLDGDLAKDILQEGILLLLNRISSGNFEFNPKLGFRSFLFRTFQNLSANINRQYRLFDSDEDILSKVGTSEAFEVEEEPVMYPEGMLEAKVQEMLYKKLSKKAAKVLEICLIRQKSNEEGARMMDYKDESIFRKKKSQHLKTFRSLIDSNEEQELYRMAG